MIPWMQRQHAHDLATQKKEDVRVTWLCPPLDKRDGSDYKEKRMFYFVESETPYWENAVSLLFLTLIPEINALQEKSQYKVYDDMKHNLKNPGPLTPVERKGGFYACVSADVYEYLLKMVAANHGRIQVVKMIEPKLMSEDEQREKLEYHATRAAAYEERKARREEEKDGVLETTKEVHEKRAQDAIDKAHKERRGNTLSAARQSDIERHRYIDFRTG